MKIKEYSTEIFIAFVFVLGCVVLYISSTSQHNAMDDFYTTNVNGKIKFVESGGRNWTLIKLKGQKKKIRLYVVVDKYSQPALFFYDVAKVGDSIYKPAYSDTIFLYNKDTVLKIYYNNSFE